MPMNNNRSLLLGCALGAAVLACPASAGPEPLPAGAGKQAARQSAPAAPVGGPTGQTGDPPAPQEGAPQGDATEQAQAPAHSGPSAAAVALARWVRAIGGRVCTGPKLRQGDRVSMPDPTDQAQGWRVSVPSFATAHVSAPPARAHTPKSEQDEAVAGETPADPVQTASEAGGA